MRALLWKELRELARWPALGAAFVGLDVTGGARKPLPIAALSRAGADPPDPHAHDNRASTEPRSTFAS
jgi:hypothetical protein